MARAAPLASRAAVACAPARHASAHSGRVAQAHSKPGVLLLTRTPASGARLVTRLGDQRRGMFIRTEETPNPASLKFLPQKDVMGTLPPREFTSIGAARASPLAAALFCVQGVTGVFLGNRFITVSKRDTADWSTLKPEIFAAIMDFYASGVPLFRDEQALAAEARPDTAAGPEDSETVLMIKELLDTRIRPTVAMDGGDIVFRGFREGIVYLQLRGSCSGCPSSSVTLKQGVENMLMHYVPEVEGVEEVLDSPETDAASADALSKLEAKIAKETQASGSA